MALKNFVDVALVLQTDMKAFRVDIDVRKSLTRFPNDGSIHVRIYKLGLAREIQFREYLDIGHEHFVEQVHIGIAKIGEVFVPENSQMTDLREEFYLSRFMVFALIRARHLSI